MKTITFPFAALLALFIINASYAQITTCTPNPSCVENIPGNGMACPEVLPDAYVDVYYDETLTIIPPSSFGTWSGVITAIRIDDVQGLPSGMAWGKNQEVFHVTNPLTRYCARLYGTPTVEGNYQLSLYITPYIGGVPMNNFQQVDDTSFVLSVKASASLGIMHENFIELFPNPAYDNFTVAAKGLESIKVFDVVGKELISIKANSEQVRVDVSNFNQSCYFVKVRTHKGEFVRKLTKY